MSDKYPFPIICKMISQKDYGHEDMLDREFGVMYGLAAQGLPDEAIANCIVARRHAEDAA